MLSERRRDRNANRIGTMLKAAREKAGYTQKALADALGLDYYTMVSQMERGYVAVPPTLWVKLADLLHLDRHDFTLRCIETYQPNVYEALFGNKKRTDAAEDLRALHKGWIVQPPQTL